MWKHEFKRMWLRKSVLVALVWLLAMTLFSYYKALSYPNTIGDYGYSVYPMFLMKHNQEAIDLAQDLQGEVTQENYEGIENKFLSYINENALSDEEIQANIDTFDLGITIEQAKNDIEMSGFVMSEDAKDSILTSVYFDAINEFERVLRPSSTTPREEILRSYNAIMKTVSDEVVQDYVDRIDNKEMEPYRVGYSSGFDLALEMNNYLPISFGVFLVLFLVPFFTQDKSYNVEKQILSTKYGKQDLLLKRISIALLSCIAMFLIVQSIQLFMALVTFGLEGATNIVGKSFYVVPYQISFISLYLKGLFFGVFATVFISLILIMISIHSSKSILISTVCFMIIFTTYITTNSIGRLVIGTEWKLINPLHMYRTGLLFYTYNPIQIGKTVMLAPIVTLVTNVMIAIIVNVHTYNYVSKPRKSI